MNVRLYRPGYKLVEFKSWQLGGSVNWVPAESLADRERAIDDLLGSPRSMFTGPAPESSAWSVSTGVRDGSASLAHRKSLEFIATEYAKLAEAGQKSLPDITGADRARLLDKAAKVREHAEAVEKKTAG